ncbi:MAG: hypothetical protein IPO21_15435 [Bacteroidales bacterium]|nr:hypothetical protein [Bacteroidales bacterium]
MKHIYLLLIALVLSTSIYSQTEFWGTSRYGGANGTGYIFKTDGNGNNLSILYSFPKYNNTELTPFYPMGDMILAPDGNFYGNFASGCSGCGRGGIYQFNPKTYKLEGKIFFPEQYFGSVENKQLVLGEDGNIYGITINSGEYNRGCFFKYNPEINEINTIIDFNGLNGDGSHTILKGLDGEIYVQTYTNLCKYDPKTDTFTIIYESTGQRGRLILDSDNTMYGVTYNDNDKNEYFTIFKYNLNNNDFSYSTIPTILNTSTTGMLLEIVKYNESNISGCIYGQDTEINYDITTNTISKIDIFDQHNIMHPTILFKANNNMVYGFGLLFYQKLVLFEYNPLINEVKIKYTSSESNQQVPNNFFSIKELPIQTQLSAQYRNTTLEKIFSPIACDAVVGATNYTWRFTSGTEVITYETTTTSNILNPAEAGIKFNTQYSVEVKAKINNTWGIYGEAFQITTPQTIPTSKLQTAYCGITINALTESIKCIATSGATQYEYTFVDNVSGKKIVIKNLSTLRLDKVATLEYGRTYTVTVRPVFNNSYGNSDGSCTITTPATIPTTRLSEPYRNMQLTALNTTIYCDKLPCVSDYQWEVTDAVTNKVLVKLRGNNSNSFQLSMINGIDYGRTYKIRIKGVSGTLKGAYAESFNISTPTEVPTTSLQENYCNKTFSSPNDLLVCNTVLGATNYEWEVKDVAGNILGTKLKGSSSTTMTLALILTVEYNKTYEVRVRAKTSTKTGNYGSVCTVIFSGTTLTSKYCGITLTALNQSVFCNQIPNAIGYEWEVTSPTGAIYPKRFNTATSYFVKFNAIFTPEYGKTYQVRIKPIFSTGDGEFGAACSLTTPAFPDISLIETDCGSEITSLNQNISCTPILGVLKYEWQIYAIDGFYVNPITTTTPYLNIKDFRQENSTFYSIRVKGITNTQWQVWKLLCYYNTIYTEIRYRI